MPLHRNLSGDQLHEPKGVDTAANGEVYVADGAGSGAWADLSSDFLSKRVGRVVYVNEEDDFGTAVGGEIQLDDNCTYIVMKDLS